MSIMSPDSTFTGTTGEDSTAVPPLSRQEWALLCSAYLSQFVASSFFYMAMTAILRSRGVPLEQLGWIYLLGIVPGFKFLWAPVLDRYGFGRHGHFGIWLALMQALLIITLLWLGTLPMSPEQPLPLAALVTGCLLLTSVQDIAAYMAFYTPVDVLLPTLMMERASGSTLATDFSMQNGICFGSGILINSTAPACSWPQWPAMAPPWASPFWSASCWP